MPCINDLIEYAKTKNNGITTDDIFSFFEINDKQVTHNEYELLIMQLNNNGIDIVEPEDIDNTTGEIYNINEGSLDAKTQYLKEVKQYKLLSKEEERELFKQYKAGSKQAFDKLVESNLRLVYKFAIKRLGNGMDILDLAQEGNIGLIKAIQQFDYTKGYKFSTYACYWIRRSIDLGIFHRGHIIKKSKHCLDAIKDIRIFQSKYYRQHGEMPTKEITKENFKKYNVIFDYAYFYATTDIDSLDREKIPESDTPLIDFVKDETESIEEIYERKESREMVNLAFDIMVNKRTTEEAKKTKLRDIEIVKLRFGFGENKNMPCEKIAPLYGISRQRVDQIIKSTLLELKSIILSIEHNTVNKMYRYKK